jgi:hypothetical protein
MDKDKNPIKIYFKESKDSNKLVEEYMDMSSKIYQNIDNIKYKIELMKEASIPK